jgi:hypothetical protein
LDPPSEGLLLLTTHGHLKAQLENSMKFFNTTLRLRLYKVAFSFSLSLFNLFHFHFHFSLHIIATNE